MLYIGSAGHLRFPLVRCRVHLHAPCVSRVRVEVRNVQHQRAHVHSFFFFFFCTISFFFFKNDEKKKKKKKNKKKKTKKKKPTDRGIPVLVP